ncbi:MAG: TonB-dependent receptor plug domain-containing protein [Janthinobacterium lividum]
MKINLLLITLLLSGMVFSQNTSGQSTLGAPSISDTTINKIISRLRYLSDSATVERAYLHMDKSSYHTGDTVYFKAYVTLGEKNGLSQKSKILYVELIQGTSIRRTLKIMLIGGIGWGEMNLPDTLTSGSYRIRAYTQWVRNFGEAYFFNKTINIIGRLSNLNRTVMTSTVAASQPNTNRSSAVNLQFFPEGGEMVTGLRSKVAFKAEGSNGLGTDVKGIVKDDLNNTVATFTSLHLGMGVFELRPEAGRFYRAYITQPSGITNIYNLPQKIEAGTLLSVKNDSNELTVEIDVNKQYFVAHKNEDFNLIIYQPGVLKAVKTKLDNPVMGLELPVSGFKTGIVQLVVLSATGEPLNERLVFVQNQNQINLKLDSLKTVYQENEKVKVDLAVNSSNTQAAKDHFSVSVINEDRAHLSPNTEPNILTDLLLTSNLKEYIEQPDYYFSGDTKDARQALDLLMLMQDYKRFSWKQLLNNQDPPFTYAPENALRINGTVVTAANQPVKNAQVTMLSVADSKAFSTNTDSAGKFLFPNLIFMDSTRFIFTATTASGKNNVHIKIDNNSHYPAISNFFDPEHSNTISVIEKTDHQTARIKTADTSSYKLQKSILLKTVNVKGYKKDDDNYRSFVLGGPGHADQVLHAKDVAGMSTLVTALNGRLRGVTFIGNQPYLTLSLMSGIGANIPQPMEIILDGTIVSSPEFPNHFDINIINPEDVETVEVLKSATASIYGMSAGGGVLVITTKLKRNNELISRISPNMLSYLAYGFNKSGTSYNAPNIDFTLESSINKNMTVYWNPEPTADSKGKTLFQYYNTGGKGNYKMVIEGVDAAGNLIRSVYHYQVR